MQLWRDERSLRVSRTLWSSLRQRDKRGPSAQAAVPGQRAARTRSEALEGRSLPYSAQPEPATGRGWGLLVAMAAEGGRDGAGHPRTRSGWLETSQPKPWCQRGPLRCGWLCVSMRLCVGVPGRENLRAGGGLLLGLAFFFQVVSCLFLPLPSFLLS